MYRCFSSIPFKAGPEPGPRTSDPRKIESFFRESSGRYPHLPIRYSSMPQMLYATFPVIRGFEVFLFAIIPSMMKTEYILDFVKTANPTKSAAFHNKLTELIKDYSRTFLKIGEKTLESLTRIPTETEMSAIFATIRAVAKDEKYYGAFKKNMHLVHDMITNPVIHPNIKEQDIIDNGNAFKMYNIIITHLNDSTSTTTFVAKYTPDKSTVIIEETVGEPSKRGRGRSRKSA